MRVLISAILVLIAGAAPRASTGDAAEADSGTQLRVAVLDQTGAALVTASITLIDAAGGARTVATDGKGVAIFEALTPGAYVIRARADAFQSYEGPLTLKKGQNTLTIKLPLAGLTEQIVVQQSDEDARGNSFTRTLSEAEIEELPDDPDEMEQMLMQMAGPGAVMRINGFRGGQLPPKSQIRQIRFRMNSYAAENHDAGGFGIDVLTKPGMDDWRGMSGFSFRDESLNARNYFSPVLGPEQYRRVNLNFNGPLVKGKTSLAVASDGNFSYDSKTLNATLPDQTVTGDVRRPADISRVTVRVEHALTRKQTMLFEVQRQDDKRQNLGVGDFDLPSRSYSRHSTGTVVRGALNGLLAPKIAHELKVQFQGDETETSSSSSDPAVIVIDQFSTGGAGQQSRRRSRSIEIDDNIDFSFSKKHAVRAGLQLEGYWYNSLDLRNSNGTFTFAGLTAYELGLANTYTQRQGGTPIDFGQYQIGIYAQDDWTINKKLTVSVGVRQELQNTLDDPLNLAPRVGFTWAPNKWTFRGGWGVFNDWMDSSVYEQTLLVNGINQSDLVILRPGYPDPLESGTASVLPPSIIRLQSGLSMPHLQQASIGLERSWGDFRVQSSYMMQRGHTALRSGNANAPVPVLGRPDPSVGNITEVAATGRYNVDRWQVNGNFAQPQRRLFVGVNYIFSNTKNDADSPLSLPSNSLDPDADFGPAAQDVRHRLFVMAGFGLPMKLRMMWNSQFTSALPYNIITGLDNNGDSVTNDRPEGVGRNGARGSANWNLNARLSRSFNFGPPRQGGGQGPMPPGGGPIRVRGGPGGGGPGGDGPRVMMSSFDPNAGRYSVEFYAQAYNLLNRTNFTTYVGNLRAPAFGTAIAAAAPRRFEVGVMFGF
jgi:hypothetical protein